MPLPSSSPLSEESAPSASSDTALLLDSSRSSTGATSFNGHRCGSGFGPGSAVGKGGAGSVEQDTSLFLLRARCELRWPLVRHCGHCTMTRLVPSCLVGRNSRLQEAREHLTSMRKCERDERSVDVDVEQCREARAVKEGRELAGSDRSYGGAAS
jgi:hypothetical protein